MSAGAHPDHPDHAPARIAEFVDAWRGKTGADDETPILSAHSGHRQWSHLTLGDLRSLLRENATLRRQLEAAEAQPCDHNSDAFEALERLHGRIHRDFNFDAGECAPPTEDEIALRMMDDLVAFADEVYLPLADATKAPGPLESVVTEALADTANDDQADPESARPAPPWLVEAGDD